jgi:AcrR family transcriptional regulator
MPRPPRPPRKPSQERSKATVEAIVDAGYFEVAERGLTATTTQHIADRAGIGIGSFYEYFPNKEAVYVEMFNRLTAEAVRIIQEETPALVRMDIRAAIRHMLRLVGDMLRAKDGVYLRCARHGLRSDLPIERVPVERALAELAVQYLMRHPDILRARPTPAILYIFIHGGMHAFIQHMNEKAPLITFEQLVDGLADMVGHFAERELQMADERGK